MNCKTTKTQKKKLQICEQTCNNPTIYDSKHRRSKTDKTEMIAKTKNKNKKQTTPWRFKISHEMTQTYQNNFHCYQWNINFNDCTYRTCSNLLSIFYILYGQLYKFLFNNIFNQFFIQSCNTFYYCCFRITVSYYLIQKLVCVMRAIT